MVEELEPIRPDEAVEMYLQERATEVAHSTLKAHSYRLGHLLRWCEQKDIDNLNNVTVVIPKMPLNLSVLDQGAASTHIADSAVDTWYVGGHSLGGAMACRYAETTPERVDGVVLFVSYCDRDISEAGLDVLSVTGSADTVLGRDAYDANRSHLPSDATTQELSLNHSQFGSYRGQPGDEPSGLDDDAYDRLANVTVSWIRA